LLDPRLFDPDFGWRLGFLIGACLACLIFFMRFWIPESPRWLITHGYTDEANKVVADIESHFSSLPPAQGLPRARLRARRSTPLRLVVDVLFRQHLRRTMVGLSLMASQAFFYNAIFFTYALILTDFYGVAFSHVGWYILPFAIGNFLGPLLLGRLFDTRGRRPMIAFTYIVSGVLLALTGWLFLQNLIDETTQTVCWMVIFFFALAVRRTHRYRLARKRLRWISDRRRPHGAGRLYRVALGRRRRAQAVGKCRQASDVSRLKGAVRHEVA
jgi:MFS family permease